MENKDKEIMKRISVRGIVVTEKGLAVIFRRKIKGICRTYKTPGIHGCPAGYCHCNFAWIGSESKQRPGNCFWFPGF